MFIPKILISASFILALVASRPLLFGQTPSVSELQRSEELLEKERALRDKLEKEEKFFIRRITVKGATLLSQERVKELLLPFQKKWLGKSDIQQLLDLFTQAYRKNGLSDRLRSVSYEVRDDTLLIFVQEISR